MVEWGFETRGLILEFFVLSTCCQSPGLSSHWYHTLAPNNCPGFSLFGDPQLEDQAEAECANVATCGGFVGGIGWRGEEVFANSKEPSLMDLLLSPFKRGFKDRSKKELSMCQNASDRKLKKKISGHLGGTVG